MRIALSAAASINPSLSGEPLGNAILSNCIWLQLKSQYICVSVPPRHGFVWRFLRAECKYTNVCERKREKNKVGSKREKRKEGRTKERKEGKNMALSAEKSHHTLLQQRFRLKFLRCSRFFWGLPTHFWSFGHFLWSCYLATLTCGVQLLLEHAGKSLECFQ